ncbi:MAG: alanine racemase, partial [Desulfovibrio sp.]|nr:alanine racemase [Desulfovibrio sp.]
HIRLDAIVANYRLLKKSSTAALSAAFAPALLPGPDGEDRLFAWPAQMVVVKADAYGHGHIPVSRALADAGAVMFASGGVRECAVLRDGLEEAGYGNAVILSLLGLVEGDDAALCAAKGIIPVLHSAAQLPLFRGLSRPLAVALKCNTGMSRLGFNMDELPFLVAALRTMPLVRPVLALSHLNSADSDQGPDCIAAQGGVFAGMLEALRAEWPDLAASLANSAGTFLADCVTAAIGPHICRPGLALYGGNPFHQSALRGLGHGLRGAMSVSAPIIAVRRLNPGDALGYGQAFKADRPLPVGIVAVGYADAFTRSLSGRGRMCVEGAPAPVLGRVSMQMTAVSLESLPAEKLTPPPARAWLLGRPDDGRPWPDIMDAAELASLWGTIPYEVFCLLGLNHRVYEG